MKLWWLACVAALIAAPVHAQQNSASELAGLWAATRYYGPEARGTLWIEQRGGALSAEISGRRAAVQVAGEAVTFSLPGDLGEFRGRFEARRARLVGHWLQPRGPTMAGPGYATPVTLEAQGAGRWRGEVRPLDERMTVYLSVQPGENGVMRAFLRNPERNVGVFYNVTRLEREGDAVRLIGSRRRNGPEGVMLAGRYDATTSRLALDFSFRAGSLDFQRASPDADAGFYPRARASTYVYAPPPARDDGWPVGTVEEAGIDRTAITAFIQRLLEVPIDSLDASDVHAVLIARHGKLVLEEYFHNFTRERLHDTRSASKSVVDVMVGAAMQQGAPINASTRVYEALGAPVDDPRKSAMTVEHLLTMSSGYYCDDNDSNAPGNEDTLLDADEPDWWRFTLNLPMAGAPGASSIYCSVTSNLVGAVVAHQTRSWLPDYFRAHIAGPMDIRHYALALMPRAPDRDAYFGGSAYFEPRDFMKFGQMMMDGGVWRGRRIVSRDWAERSLAPHTRIRDRQYGYLWWVEDYPYNGRTVRASFAAGNGGQIVMAIPELDLVIAFYGGNYSNQALFIPQRVYVPQFILPAVREHER